LRHAAERIRHLAAADGSVSEVAAGIFPEDERGKFEAVGEFGEEHEWRNALRLLRPTR
jgi:hypothetical protein